MEFRPHLFTLRQLQYAVAVAESLSFRKAAERCHVSQPPLSAQIAQMEETLGVQLFERDRRRVLITERGLEIIERARRVLQQIDDIAEAGRCAADPLSGSLKIGVIPTISPYFVPRLSAELRKDFPQLTVFWREDKTQPVMRQLDDGTLDAALLALEAAGSELEHEVIGADPFVLATPYAPLGTKQSPAACRLKDATVLLLDDGPARAIARGVFQGEGRTQFRATSLSTLAQMVAGGSGYALAGTRDCG